ncbi:MAG: DNA polymerase III subunit delta [Flavobacteriales bacterium]|nr:DNA polymerase III subunit delta [Flavobacteriales bacterium]
MSVLDDLRKLTKEVRSGTFRPVYLLHGEETFFIDRMAQEIEALALQDHERDFNQTILYGRECTADQVKDTCLRYPMMAERQLVVVRELQAWRIDELEKLEAYFQKPTPTTVLVLSYMHKKVDGRKTILKSVQKGGGAVLLSDKVKEDKLPAMLTAIAAKQKRKLGANEARLLAAHLGSDLAKAVKEVEKLCLVTEPNGTITADAIQRIVGISKDHNVFELQNALGARDRAKALGIAKVFAQDPKEHPLVLTVGALNTYFSKLAIVHGSPGVDQNELARRMGVPPFFLRDYTASARNFNISQLAEIQRHLRQADLRSKGVGDRSASDGELLIELVERIAG